METSELIERLHEEFDPIFGNQGVTNRIDRALNHKASAKWKNPERGLRDWLKRDAEKMQPESEKGPNTRPPTWTQRVELTREERSAMLKQTRQEMQEATLEFKGAPH